MRKSVFYCIAAVFILVFIAHPYIGIGQNLLGNPTVLSTKKVSSIHMVKLPVRPPTRVYSATTSTDAVKNSIPNLFDSGDALFKGIANSSYDLSTGEMWLTAIQDPRTLTYSIAAFRSGAIKNAGNIVWKGVTVTATYQVISIFGSKLPDEINLIVGIAINNNLLIYGENTIRLENTNTITSEPFDIYPGTTMQPMTYIYIRPSGNRSTGVYAKLLSLKITI